MSRRDVILNPFEDERDDNRRTKRSRKTSKRRRWPIVLLLLVLLLAFLPNLIGLTGLHQQAVNYALSDFQGTIKIKKATLGWLQPVRLSGIAAVDANGKELFQIEQVSSSKSLLAFLNGKDYGQFNIQSPTIFLHLRPDGSNLEDAIAKYMAPAPGKEKTSADKTNTISLPKLTVNVLDGRAQITSSTDPQSWQIDKLKAILQTASEAAPLAIEADCQVTPMKVDAGGQIVLQNPGTMVLSSQFDPGATTLQLGSIDLSLITNNLPVSLVAPILQRFVGPAQSAGQLSGNLRSKIDLNTQSMNLELANLNLKSFALAAPQMIGADQVVLQNLTANGSMQLSPQIISSTNFQLASDFGRVNANGRFDVNQLTQLASGGELLDTPFQMDGQIDLAGLVRMLPSTLKLHEDLEVESGTVQFQASSKNEEGTRRLIMNLDTANLKARRGAQNIVWNKPLRLVGTIAQTPQGLAIEDLSCESDFLAIAGSANLQTAAFRAQGDLSKLMERVGQFVDLAGTELAGELDGNFGWQTAEPQAGVSVIDQPIQIGGRFVVTNPVIQMPGMAVWKQPQLSIKMSASGQSTAGPNGTGQALRLDHGGMQIEVGTEQVLATLAAPVVNAFIGPWNLQCQLTGDLNGWIRHIQNFVDIGAVQAAGQINLTCAAALDNNLLQLTNVQYEVQQLAFNGYGMKIRDPKANGTGTATYDLATGQIAIADTTLTASSIAARGQNLTIALVENIRVDGGVAFRADLNRVADWFELSPTEDSVFWFGSAEGNLQLASNENGIGGRLTSIITDLVAAQRAPNQPVNATIQPVSNQIQWKELFREAKTEFNSELLLANDFNAIQFANTVVKSSALTVKANGSLSELATSMLTNIQGSWNPDWQKINTLLGAYTGNLVQLAGSGEQPFSLRGPVFTSATNTTEPTAWIPPALEATTSVRWDQGSVLNVPVGASQLDLDVRNSFGNIKTSGIPFSGGVVKFAPGIDMRGENPLLVMDQTRIIDNVALSAETTRQWLKYVAPLVADATSAQGNFTIDINSVRMPILDPMAIESRGAIRLANVAIGAGPMADQLIATITQLRAILKPESAGSERDYKSLLKMSEQTIPIVIKDKRVFHDNVTFTHNDTTLRTRGSVGFDQSLSMMAEIPIADDWINGKPYLAGLKGQSVSIPIGGTVSKPQLDRRAIQQLSTDLVKKAAGSAINQAIGDKLTPKINEFQTQLNDKVGNELNKFQGQLNEKIGGGFLQNGLEGLLQNGSGNAAPGATGSVVPNPAGTPVPNGTTPAPANNGQPNLGQQLEGELMKGFGNLFNSGKK